VTASFAAAVCTTAIARGVIPAVAAVNINAHIIICPFKVCFEKMLIYKKRYA
jgi:hypothetical protein